MIQSFLTSFFNLIMSVLASLANLILAPFDLLFNSLLPDLGNSWANFVAPFLGYISHTIGWALDASMIHPAVWSLVVLTTIFSTTIRYQLNTLKIAWSWIQKIKFW